jgi:seryl-tRNA synthetase
VAKLKDELQAGESRERELDEALKHALSVLPNIPLDDVPVGKDESDNVEIRVSGTKPDLGFETKEHFELGEALGMMDFERAAKMSGSRFTILSGGLARLERALGQYMLDLHTGEHGYTEVNPPLMVNDAAAYGTDKLPKFGDDLFRTTDGRWLIPTAEVPLTYMAAGEIIAEEELPKRYAAQTACFRSEAGSAGRDTRGMLRQHQFTKVELVSVTTPETSLEEHERMTASAEAVLKGLGLHFRTIVLCTGDMGFGARKTYDIEVWLPGQKAYREISSCSVCGDFQARRMNARCRKAGDKATRFVHTLNGSGVAVGRALIAVMENYQNADGSITVPDALRPYMGGITKIEKAA